MVQFLVDFFYKEKRLDSLTILKQLSRMTEFQRLNQ